MFSMIISVERRLFDIYDAFRLLLILVIHYLLIKMNDTFLTRKVHFICLLECPVCWVNV